MEQKEKTPAEEVLAFAAAQYQTEPERLWQRYPDYLVLRHKGSRKWFGILMRVPGTVLSAAESGMLIDYTLVYNAQQVNCKFYQYYLYATCLKCNKSLKTANSE